MKMWTQIQAMELREMLKDIIDARDAFHGGDLNRAVVRVKERLHVLDLEGTEAPGG